MCAQKLTKFRNFIKDNLNIYIYHLTSLFSSGCNKSVMTTHVLTLLRECVTLTTSVTTMLIFIGNKSTLNAIKSYLRSHMIKQILHSWSFHMKFIKLAEGKEIDHSCKILYVLLHLKQFEHDMHSLFMVSLTYYV